MASYRVFGTNGPIGWHDRAIFPAGVVVGRKGAYRGIHYSRSPCWVIDTAFYLDIHEPSVDPRWAYYQLLTVNLDAIDNGSAIPSTSRDAFGAIPVAVPPLRTQFRIVEIMDALDHLIDSNQRRVELLEQMAKAIYQEWFVRLRYPGHEQAILVDSTLGTIPEGWEVKQVAEIAASGRNAVTGGPFGSKLGRKDYVETGVPVLRGANLCVGGGFDETNLVYVSEEKAEELRGSLARRGDVVVTQRGTLGQVGLIPPHSRFDRYLLSQSQMKITVDRMKAATEFIYAQLRTPATTERFIAQAMSSGVPHVNLALLRGFAIVVPPVRLQVSFSESIEHLSSQMWQLSEQRRCVVRIRDLLLPRLVSGGIDVSDLDFDPMPEPTA